MGIFVINNGANCVLTAGAASVQCSNCNGSKYDCAFKDNNGMGNEIVEVDIGWTQASTNGPNCTVGATLTVTRNPVPAGNPPAGYKFADTTGNPGVGWTGVVTGLTGAPTSVQCTYANPDPNELGVVVATLNCYKYEWIYGTLYPTYVQNPLPTLAMANLRWGTKVNGVWAVNDLVNVGYNTYIAAENKILISVANLGQEYAVFVKTAAAGALSFSFFLIAFLLSFFFFF